MKLQKSKYEESESNFSFEFDGDHYIDAETLSVTINSVIDSLQSITVKQDPEAFVKLRVTKFRDGSFDIDLKAIIGYIPSLLTTENVSYAAATVSIFVGSIQIKNFLKGKEPKSIEESGSEINITNQEDETLTVDKSTAKMYLEDSKIDTNIVNIFNVTINEPGCTGLTVKQGDSKKVHVKKDEFADMTNSIVRDPETFEILKNQIEVNLLLKKPDLLGNSKWGFVLDKNIDATIKDKDWLEKVHSGKIKNLYAGVKIPVKLLIETELDRQRNPVATHYTILKVTGDIIEPEEDNQNKLFD